MKISIIGSAGCIGSSTAFILATHSLVNELVMIGGGHQDALKQYALDLSTAMSAENIAIKSGTYEDMNSSDIVIMSAGAPQGIVTSRMEWLSANLELFQDIGKKILQYCPESIIITVTNPVDPFNYAMYLLSQNKDRRKFIGYSANDTFRFRIMSAEELKVKPHRINGIVIGEHGESQVLVFSSLQLDGKNIQVNEEFKQKIKARIPSILKTLESFKAKTGRTAGWTCAVGITAICRAIKLNSGAVLPCSAVLDGEYGAYNLSMSIPAVIGKEGIQEIKILELAKDEQEGVKNTISYLDPFMRRIEQSLGTKQK